MSQGANREKVKRIIGGNSPWGLAARLWEYDGVQRLTVAALGAGLVLASAFTVHRLVGIRNIPEVLGVAALVGLLVSTRSARQVLAGFGWRHIILGAIVTFCLVGGQFSHDKTKTFPFPSFNMYSRTEVPRPVANVLVVGTTRAGEEVLVSPATLYYSMSHNRMANLFRRLSEIERSLKAKPTATPEQHRQARANLENLTAQVLRAHNQRHPDRQVETLRVDYYLYHGGIWPDSPPPERLVMCTVHRGWAGPGESILASQSTGDMGGE